MKRYQYDTEYRVHREHPSGEWVEYSVAKELLECLELFLDIPDGHPASMGEKIEKGKDAIAKAGGMK